MKAKKILAMVLCVAMVLSTMGFTVLAEDADIIEVGADKAYETWSAAIAAATDVDGDNTITYHVYGKVLVDSHNIKGVAATINIVGMTDDAELSVETANPTDNGVVYVSDNTIETVNFSNLKLSRPNGEWRGNEGHHNRFFTVWDSDGSTDLITYTSCVFPYGAGNNQYGKTTYTDCDFYNDVYYALWIYGSGDKGVVEVTGGTFDADRGVKIYSEDASATVSTTITDSTFAIDSKPAIVSSIAGELVVEDVDVTECEYGLLASEPKDGRSDLVSAAVTVDGETPVYVAKVGNMVCTDMDYAEAESSDTKPVEIPVAIVNGQTAYTSIQAAIDAATDGDTITLLADHNGDVTVTQNADIDIILDGNGKNFDGTIYIHGKARYNGAETLTIQNVNFVTDEAKDFISCNTTDSDKRYAHNVTIKNCHFEGSENADVVAMRFRQCYNINVEDCSFEGLHSVMWATGGGNGLTFDNITAEDCKNGISTGTSAEVVVKNSTIEAVGEGGYGIRTDASGAYTLTVENSDIDAYYPIITRKATSTDYALNIEDGSNFTATNADGYDIVVTSGKDDEAFVKAEINIDIAETVDASVFSTHLASVNGVFYKTLADAVNAANSGDVIDLLGGTVDLPEGNSLKITKDLTIQNGTIDITNGVWNGNSIIEVYGGTADDFIVATFNDVDFVGDNYSSAFGVIYAYNYGKVVINGCDFDLSNEKYSAGGVLKGNGVGGSAFDVTNSTFDLENPNRIINNATVNLESVKIDAVVTDDTLVVGEMNNHAFRNVVGNVNNSDIYVDGFETGIKNTVDGEVLTVTDSAIKVTNTANGNPDIYLTGRDKLVNTNSIIDAKIFIDGGEGEDVVLVTLNFATNGGSAIDTVEKNQGEVVDLSGYKPEKSGYTFAGWYSDEALTEKVTSVTLDSPVTVYAKWREKTINVGGSGGSSVSKYTITFQTNGGTSVDNISKFKNVMVDLSEYITEKEGYTFEGWYTDEELTNKVTSVKVKENITLYAKWSDNTTGDIIQNKPEVFTDEHYAYIVGRDGNKICPNDNITRAEVATIFFRVLSEEVRNENLSNENSFSDVSDNAWFNTAVSTLANMGILNGRTEDKFEPDAYITRAEFTAIAARFSDAVYGGKDFFADTDGHWAREYINEAANLGWVVGENGIFRPDDNITRAEVMTLVNRILGRVPESKDDLLDGMNTWIDNADADVWYYLAIQEATNSHEYEMKSDGVHEKWTSLTENSNWIEIER